MSGAKHQPTLPLLRADHCMDKFPGQLDDPGYHQIVTKIDGKAVVVADTLNRDSRYSREDDERHVDAIVRACNSHDALVAALEKFVKACGRCNGTGSWVRYGRPVASRFDCDHCADDRALLKAARGES